MLEFKKEKQFHMVHCLGPDVTHKFITPEVLNSFVLQYIAVTFKYVLKGHGTCFPSVFKSRCFSRFKLFTLHLALLLPFSRKVIRRAVSVLGIVVFHI